MSDHPSLREEVNRKAFEVLEKINTDYTLGKINKAQFKYGVDIAWLLVSGLISEDIFKMFELLGQEANSISYSEKSYYRHPVYGWTIVLIDSKVGLIIFKLMKLGDKDKVNSFDFRQEPNPYLSAKAKFEYLEAGFIKAGFVKL